MNKFKELFFLLIILAGITVSCGKDPIPTPDPGDGNGKTEAPDLTQKVNVFMEDVMTDVYLWYNEVPDIDTRYEFDSKAYFEKLLYTDDKWSFATDNIAELENSFEGIEKSYGWSLAFGRFSDTGTIFALVEFVYPNTPAEQAGLKRGDLIYQMNSADITDDNYMDLLNGESLSCTFGQYGGDGIANSKTISMTALELNLNPVQFTRIIEEDGHKIGYLFYGQFIGNYNDSLDVAFKHFLDEGISDLVVDLRYNPGGTTTAAQHLCSSVAPIAVVNAAEKLVSFRWNDKYQEYWEQGNVMNQLQIDFISSVPYKLNLSKMYFLTGQGTASASELTITGLKPYMDVKTVGETTYGKYTASITMKPEDFYDQPNYYADFDNWGIQPIILRYANSQGVTDFRDGFTPDIPVEDDLFNPTPLGEKTEALLKAAIEDITGTEIVAMKSTKVIRPHTFFDRGFSKFDVNKRELLYDQIDKDILLK